MIDGDRPDYSFDESFEIDGFKVSLKELEDGAIHLAVWPLDGEARPDFHDLQAIKSEVGGADRMAVEIYPADEEVVDEGGNSATHLFILPPGEELPYDLPDSAKQPEGAIPEPEEAMP